MKKIKDLPNYKDCEFIKGLRVGNISLKVYMSSEKKYMVVRSRYLFGVPIHKTEILVDDYEEADDMVRNLKFDSQCGKV